MRKGERGRERQSKREREGERDRVKERERDWGGGGVFMDVVSENVEMLRLL